jgi:hypothetical protein
MKLFYYFVTLMILISLDSLGQNSIFNTLRAQETLTGVNKGLSGNEVLYGIPMPEPTLVGDSYFNKDWKKSSVALYEREGLLTGYLIRFELLKNELEVKTNGGVKIIEGSRVSGFMLTDSIHHKPTYFINGKDFKLNELAVPGFLEVIVDGKYMLVKKHDITIRKSDYNMKLDVGRRNDEIIRSSALYYVQANELKKAPRTKNGVVQVFSDKRSEIEKFIKINNLNLKLEDHLEAVFKHYNSL